MSEYEERYPEAYGRREETDAGPLRRHFFGRGLPRQVRDAAPMPMVARTHEQPAPRPAERPRHVLVERTPRQICEDVTAQLEASPFIDASGIVITVDDDVVTLEGTINSLIAISLAKALASNVPGVSWVEVRMSVRPAPRGYAG
jgi:hypothetical protein